MRPLSSLETKWSMIKLYGVFRFCIAYKNVVSLNILGTSLDDTFVKAKELFHAKHPKKKVFGFQLCWDVLKDVSKWQDLGPLVNRKSSEKADQSIPQQPLMNATNDQSPPDDGLPPLAYSDKSIDSQSTNFKRPIGNKVANDQLKPQKI